MTKEQSYQKIWDAMEKVLWCLLADHYDPNIPQVLQAVQRMVPNEPHLNTALEQHKHLRTLKRRSKKKEDEFQTTLWLIHSNMVNSLRDAKVQILKDSGLWTLAVPGPHGWSQKAVKDYQHHVWLLKTRELCGKKAATAMQEYANVTLPTLAMSGILYVRCHGEQRADRIWVSTITYEDV